MAGVSDSQERMLPPFHPLVSGEWFLESCPDDLKPPTPESYAAVSRREGVFVMDVKRRSAFEHGEKIDRMPSGRYLPSDGCTSVNMLDHLSVEQETDRDYDSEKNNDIDFDDLSDIGRACSDDPCGSCFNYSIHNRIGGFHLQHEYSDFGPERYSCESQ